PEGHRMSYQRPNDEKQIEMFSLIDETLRSQRYRKYEISNYSQPGLESRHNQVYWNGHDYWGLGLSAHSYQASRGWGFRYWNPKRFEEYEAQVQSHAQSFDQILPTTQREDLNCEEALTDSCHMAFRQPQGLCMDAVRKRYSQALIEDLQVRLKDLQRKGWVKEKSPRWVLTREGETLLNQVLLDLCFIAV
ncbi:MAG: coproporphyrinogen III oxidase family protein, partial [Bdellovibrionales bacterium]|nr:coproporphyrinogen III oxidase family protein [Bdellovibrionales bacterium]